MKIGAGVTFLEVAFSLMSEVYRLTVSIIAPFPPLNPLNIMPRRAIFYDDEKSSGPC